MWGLPDAVVESTAYHHEPAQSARSGATPLTAVHIGQAIADAIDGPPAYDLEHLARCAPADEVETWTAAAHEAMVRFDGAGEDAA